MADFEQLPISSSDRQWDSSNGAPTPAAAPPAAPPPPPASFKSPLPPPSFSPPSAAGYVLRPPPLAEAMNSSSPRPFAEIPISPARAQGAAEHQHQHQQQQQQQQQQQPEASSANVQFSSQVVLRERKLANALSLPFGAMVSPYREHDVPPPVVDRKPHRCDNCGGYPSLYSRLSPSSAQWQCVLCQKINSSEGEYRPASRDDLHHWPELVSPVVEYIDGDTWRPGFVPVADSATVAPVILVVDESIEEALLQHLQSSLHAFLDNLGPSTRIGIISYGKTVSIYDLSESSLAAADVLPGGTSPSQELLKTLIYGTGVYLAPVHSCLQICHTIVSSLRPYKGNLREAARPRCLGTSVEVALALVQGPSTHNVVRRGGGSSRILVCAAGPSTLGPGSLPQFENHPNYEYICAQAVKYMERLGRDAKQADTTVDILCAGTCPVKATTLEPLAKASTGMIVLHDDFGEAFGLNLQRSITRAAGYRGTLTVRCSDSIGVARVIGPGQEAKLEESFRQEPAVALRMASVGENHGFAMIMQLTKDLQSDHAYFQFVFRYTSIFQTRITSVVTIRLPVTSSVPKYLQSMDTNVAALLIAKKTVLQAKSMSDAVEMRLSVDERLKDIASKFGNKMPKSRVHLFPRELSRLPEILFHLRRGPLLGSIVGHEDERWVLRSIFLQASYELSLRMLLPRLLMYHEGGTFEEVPAYNLAMQSETALVLDHGTDVYIWMGMDLCQDEKRSASAFAACKTLVQEIAETRFPAPRMLAFKEGSSQARYLHSRLVPAHDEPTYEQEARFPQLQSLNAEQRTKLKFKFVKTDEASLSVWLKSLKLTSSHSS